MQNLADSRHLFTVALDADAHTCLTARYWYHALAYHPARGRHMQAIANVVSGQAITTAGRRHNLSATVVSHALRKFVWTAFDAFPPQPSYFSGWSDGLLMSARQYSKWVLKALNAYERIENQLGNSQI